MARPEGFEWDTVIFSVVDAQQMYFCGTTNVASHGLQVVNTAVTRARKRLVIVCDTEFWGKQNGQLIESLLDAALRTTTKTA